MMILLHMPNAYNKRSGITQKQAPILQIWSVKGNGQREKGLGTIAWGKGLKTIGTGNTKQPPAVICKTK